MHFRTPVADACVITQKFGRTTPAIQKMTGRRDHPGIDLAPLRSEANLEWNVFCSAPGIVVETGDHREAGKFIVVSHKVDDALFHTYYFHLEQVFCCRSLNVNSYDRIGIMGSTGMSTGKHLHFGIARLLFYNMQFIDPCMVIKFK